VARESLRDARRSVRALRPAALDTGTLPAALGEVLARFERHHRVPVHQQVTGQEAPLAASVEDALLKAAHEALTNVARHANATEVHVTLSFLGDAVALDVADDGTGSAQNGGGQGLAIMRERVGAVGGDVAVETAPGAGTTITVTVPLDRARDHDLS
jgi:signal transduction histidine kinase